MTATIFESTRCQLVGAPINLSGKKFSSAFFAPTAEACDWGAALEPIWIGLNSTQPVQVLGYGGHSFSLAKQTQNDLRNIRISTATAGRSYETQWRFDGSRYIKVNENVRIEGAHH